MGQYSKLTTINFTGTILFLFFMLWGFKAAASDNDTLRQRILDRVAGHVTLGTNQVTVYVEDGFVLLTGSVHLYLQKMDFEQIAWKTTGVTEVENEIEVKALFPLSDTIIKRKIRMILMDYKCFHGVNYIVKVDKGIVLVTGVFFYPRDVQFLKRKIAGIEGVVAIDIHTTALIANKPEAQEE
jgi:osmotically-inducible protein OsmY